MQHMSEEFLDRYCQVAKSACEAVGFEFDSLPHLGDQVLRGIRMHRICKKYLEDVDENDPSHCDQLMAFINWMYGELHALVDDLDGPQNPNLPPKPDDCRLNGSAAHLLLCRCAANIGGMALKLAAEPVDPEDRYDLLLDMAELLENDLSAFAHAFKGLKAYATEWA